MGEGGLGAGHVREVTRFRVDWTLNITFLSIMTSAGTASVHLALAFCYTPMPYTCSANLETLL